jgi:hypothetical protein
MLKTGLGGKVIKSLTITGIDDSGSGVDSEKVAILAYNACVEDSLPPGEAINQQQGKEKDCDNTLFPFGRRRMFSLI